LSLRVAVGVLILQTPWQFAVWGFQWRVSLCTGLTLIKPAEGRSHMRLNSTIHLHNPVLQAQLDPADFDAQTTDLAAATDQHFLFLRLHTCTTNIAIYTTHNPYSPT
jgi:hypothetical protein